MQGNKAVIISNLKKAFLKITKISFAVALILFFTWSISQADDFNPFTPSIKDAETNFSVIGTVFSLDNSHIIITNAKGSDDTGDTEYNINIKNLDTIENNEYQAIDISSVKQGDSIIIQGKTTGSVFFATRLILFESKPEIPEQETATTTDEIATTTQDTTETASSSSDSDSSKSIIETVKEIIQDGIDVVSNTIDEITDIINPETSTSTEEQIVPEDTTTSQIITPTTTDTENSDQQVDETISEESETQSETEATPEPETEPVPSETTESEPIINNTE